MAKTRKIRALEQDVGELLATHDSGADLSTFAPWSEDPVGFIREVLGGEPWARQVEIAEAVRDHPQVAVRSCNGAGKDWLAARLALWWAVARGGLAVLTGPTEAQVSEILMRNEVWRAFAGADPELPGDLHVRAYRPGGEGRAGIVAKTATEVSSLTGLHRAEVLFVITEAQHEGLGVAFDAAFANAVGERDRKLVLGNPLNPAGRFYRAHQPTSDWRASKIAAADVPNVREGRVVVPGLMTAEGVDRIAREYGTDSGYYQARVLAEFPEEMEEGVFTSEMLDRAARLYESGALAAEAVDRPPVLAVDPARFGPDASVVALRRGPVVVDLLTWEGRTSTMELAGRVAEAARRLELRPRPNPEVASRYRDVSEENTPEDGLAARGRIIVDEVGLGAGVADRLDELGWNVRPYNGGRKAGEPERFYNRRAESYWTLRQRLERGEVALPSDPELREELLALRWRPTSDGRVQLEAKRDLKSRLGRSPDKSDAVVMSLDRPPERGGGVAPVWGAGSSGAGEGPAVGANPTW